MFWSWLVYRIYVAKDSVCVETAPRSDVNRFKLSIESSLYFPVSSCEDTYLLKNEDFMLQTVFQTMLLFIGL